MTKDRRVQPTFCVGTSEGGDRPISVNLSEDVFATHVALIGGTGIGKSRLTELFCRQAIPGDGGFCLLDPHSTVVDAALADFATWIKTT